MKEIICGKSAFCFYRTHPLVRDQLRPLSSTFERQGRNHFENDDFAVNCLGLPVHFLARDANELGHHKFICRHLWAGDLPEGACWETDSGKVITTPAFTLFTLASELPFERLVMAMYEMCGNFTFFKPTARAKKIGVKAACSKCKVRG